MPKVVLAALASMFLLVPLVPLAASNVGPKGAMTCDFAVDPSGYPADELAGVIERDRMYMAERPGMLHKHIPVRPDATGKLLAGGRYLFETAASAKEYLRWVREDFVLDGEHFFDRAAFSDVDCHAWSTIGSTHFGDIRTEQVVLRTERWSAPDGDWRGYLRAQWPAIEADADARGLSAVWLLYQKQERLVSIVSFAPRLALSPDAGLVALEMSPTLGPMFDAHGWPRTLDRTQWVFTIWFPYAFADSGEPSLWPNSPLLPAPHESDSVCEPSRGEDSGSAPDDCTPTCGDGVPDVDETTRHCPSDVRLH